MNKIAIATTLALARKKLEVPPAAPETPTGVCGIPRSIDQPVIAASAKAYRLAPRNRRARSSGARRDLSVSRTASRAP
jgi:hypothetical protein